MGVRGASGWREVEQPAGAVGEGFPWSLRGGEDGGWVWQRRWRRATAPAAAAADVSVVAGGGGRLRHLPWPPQRPRPWCGALRRRRHRAERTSRPRRVGGRMPQRRWPAGVTWCILHAPPPPPVCSASTWYLGKRHGVRVPGVAAAVAASPPCAGTGSGAHGHIRLHPGRRGPLGCALAILGGGKGVARLPRPPQRPHLWHSAWPRRRQRVGGMNRPRRSVSRRRWGAEVADWAERSASGGSFGFGGRRQRQRLSSGWQIGLPPSRGLPRPMERLRRASGRETRSPLTSHRHLFGTPCFCSLLRALVNARGSGALRRH